MKYQSQIQMYKDRFPESVHEDVRQKHIDQMAKDIGKMLLENGEIDVHITEGRDSHPEHNMDIITLSLDTDRHIRTIWKIFWNILPTKYMFEEGVELLINDVKTYQNSLEFVRFENSKRINKPKYMKLLIFAVILTALSCSKESPVAFQCYTCKSNGGARVYAQYDTCVEQGQRTWRDETFNCYLK